MAILSTNPGSSAFVHRDGAFFQRMYICLDACKKGFIHGCRPIICLDACHLKGDYGGQLLCAIGKDGNDDMFPIAIAVAEAETRDSWQWFIAILFEDLCGPDGGLGWTIMSDRQKGLGIAVKAVLPHAEHCFCVRHLHANLKAKGYTRKAMKDELWGAARASNVYAFDHHMRNIMSMEKGAHDYLSGVPKASWSRHAFNCQTKSDMLLNNLVESFNAWIKEARIKPILTMLEEIRLQIMARFQQKRNGIRSTHYTICPKIQKKLKRSKSDARNCISRWQNELEFEIEHIYEPRRLVRLDHRTCTCGRWQMDKYMQGYAARVYGMEGPQTWPADDPCDEIQPPIIRRAPGRPKISRRKDVDESTNPYKLTRSGYIVKCGNCGGLGHNYKGCHLPLNPDRKRWKPKKYKPKKDAAQAQTLAETEKAKVTDFWGYFWWSFRWKMGVLIELFGGLRMFPLIKA
ncbi:uncharacterized protein LOC132190960 [Corylus avellana]|uniref:uncharacterized protein LOC132190960 n=1 Tax=Corylus avellana TaxID=13451 RepID=UPI00286CDC8C|nr:uncharacterized protein LOC132190960 [Corylus avellana]